MKIGVSMYIFLPLVVLGVIIAIHEFGHFSLAKLFNVKVLKFSVGFSPTIISKKIGETEYSIGAIPLGGYVKMEGEFGGQGPSTGARSYDSKPRWQRIIILLAGPAFNFISGFLLVLLSFSTFGIPVYSNNGEVVFAKTTRNTLSVSLDYSVKQGGNIFYVFGELLTGKISPKDNLGGPLRIAQEVNKTNSDFGWAGLLLLAAILSFNLGILNLFPVPILDGGNIAILLIEIVIGRSLSKNLKNNLMLIGLIALLTLMSFVIFLDISRLF